MVRVLLDNINELRPLEKEIGSLEIVANKVRNIREFDEFITSRTHGYGTPSNYYRKASSALVLSDIAIPSLFIQALDDPVVWYYFSNNSENVIPYDECKMNPHIMIATHPRAGHLGFYTGIIPRHVNIQSHNSG